MKTRFRKMLTAALALSMIVSMTGCGDSESSSTENKTSIVDKAERIKPEYAYYNDLATEWEKTGDTSMIPLTAASQTISNIGDYALQNGKIIFIDSEKNADSVKLLVYDIASKQLKKSIINAHYLNNSEFYYSNGYVYYSELYNNIKKFDLDGNEIASIDGKYFGEYGSPAVATSTGYVCIGAEGFSNTAKNEYLTPDFKIKTFPDPKGTDSHGLETKISYHIIGSYGNKFYAIGYNSVDNSNAMYYFDVETEEWTKTIDLKDQKNINNNRNKIKTIGKYLLFADSLGTGSIYNMESDALIADDIPRVFNDVFLKSYYGGNYNITYDRTGVFKRTQVPIEGKEVKNNDSSVESFGKEQYVSGVDITMLDNTYYIYRDYAGLFLRKYETGNSEEEIIYQLNK